MNDQQFNCLVDLLTQVLLQLQQLNERFERYDAEEQISDEMLREVENG